MSQVAPRDEKLGLAELMAIGIGGGIFSVLGLAVNISGHAAVMLAQQSYQHLVRRA